jgi:hypothetical protein
MARSLGKKLQSGGVRIHAREIWDWVPELTAKEGVADLVVTPSPLRGEQLAWLTRLSESVHTPGEASVLAALELLEPLQLGELARRTDLSEGTVGSIARRMASKGVLWGTPKFGFRLLRPVRESDVELWAYELKLRDWRHGLYQAVQYRAFAHRVSVVVPNDATRLVVARLAQFRSLNVGVLTFDAHSGQIRSLVRPRRAAPGSLSHYIFALAAFIRAILHPGAARRIPRPPSHPRRVVA